MGIVGRLHAVVYVVVVDIVLALARSRRGHVRAILISRDSVRESRGAFHVKDVVVEIGICGPPRPIGVENYVYVFIFPNIDRVVVDEGVLHRAGEFDSAMMIVLADVVADDGAGIASAVLGSLGTVVADQEKSAFVVVAIVVLNDGVAAVPVLR